MKRKMPRMEMVAGGERSQWEGGTQAGRGWPCDWKKPSGAAIGRPNEGLLSIIGYYCRLLWPTTSSDLWEYTRVLQGERGSWPG